MTGTSCRTSTGALLIVLLLGSPASGKPVSVALAPVLGSVEERRALLESSLARAVDQARQRVVGWAPIAVSAIGVERRRRATRLLAASRELVEQVHYEAALRTLAAAEREARAGLALFVAPRLLADIFYYRGLALLPTDRARGTQSLVQSFQLHPERRPIAGEHPPKIERAIAGAVAQARTASLTRPSDVEAAQAAQLLGVDRLVVLLVRRGARREEAILVSWDAARSEWREAGPTGWDTSADQGVVVVALARALDEILPAHHRVARRPRASRLPPPSPWSRRRLPLALASLGVAALAGGAVLLGLARGRENAAQELADKPTPVDYEPRVREIEDAGRRYDAAGIACLAVGGAALVAATTVWLLRRSEPAPAARARLSVGPGGVRVALTWR